jgi:hypothetical protein
MRRSRKQHAVRRKWSLNARRSSWKCLNSSKKSNVPSGQVWLHPPQHLARRRVEVAVSVEIESSMLGQDEPLQRLLEPTNLETHARIPLRGSVPATENAARRIDQFQSSGSPSNESNPTNRALGSLM